MKNTIRVASWILVATCTLLAFPPTSFAQGDDGDKSAKSDKKDKKKKDPGTLEDRVKELEGDVKDLRKKLNESDDGIFADGILTLGGGATLQFGGKLELLLIDPDEDSMPSLGPTFATEEPDAHLILQRLRLAPVARLNRHISLRGQLDFRPTDGDTVLKEAIARHDSQPLDWLKSRFQIGLDDRFIRPARRTKGYPLIGNAFWRDESMAVTWALSFGHRKGMAAARAAAEKGRQNRTRSSAGTDSFNEDFDGDDVSSVNSGAPSGPFDFLDNWGQIQVVLSVGQGYELGSNEVNFDGARFNDIVQDDRELENDLALREIGVGLGWRRSFEQYGDLGLLAFFFDDELRANSISFLQGTDMTLRNGANQPIAGYGDSGDDGSQRHGITVEYFLPASTIFENLDTRKRDGLRILFQWIRGEDGAMTREGCFLQGSYRFSFGKLVAKRYFRSFEPILRIGTLEVDTPFGRDPSLPGTWDREQIMFGGILEVTSEIFVKVEYVINDETTGGASVANNELLVQMLISLD